MAIQRRSQTPVKRIRPAPPVARISSTKRPRRFRRGLREARTYGAASKARMRPYQMPALLFVNAMPGTPHPKLLTTVAPGRLVA